jgi:serine/threonine-protein kinase
MRIFLADDDVAALEALGDHLRSWGYEPLLARSGIDAWRTLQREDAPSIAILDGDLSGLSGLELCRMVRSSPHGAGVYVIVTASRDRRIDLVEAREAGADDFLSKPISARELQFRIAKAVALREGRPRARFGSIPPSAALPSTPPPAGVRPNAITLAGRYRLERRVAQGAKADVWLGVHLSLGVNVAVKFTKPELAATLDYPAFERDARAIAQLRNEHVLRVYGHGSYEGLPYLVTDYLVAESLARRVARLGPLGPDEVVTLVEQIAEALADAHARGIVHRDVRPDNVLVLEDRAGPERFTVKLVDFAFTEGALARSGEARGPASPSYASPECLRGDVAPDASLDAWGLAATAFTAATGARPFSGDTLGQVFTRVCVDPLPVPSQINPAVAASFDAWFARACSRDAGARFADLAAMVAALRAARASDRSRVPRAPDPVSRRPGFVPTAPGSARSLSPLRVPAARVR